MNRKNQAIISYFETVLSNLSSIIVLILQKIELPFLKGLSFYELLKLYGNVIVKGELSYRAAAISWSFFMALFPFALFILNLIPFIPIENFQADFLEFVANGVPPRTYDAIENIINDIMHNSHSGLLSTGFVLSIFLMANGLNAILSGFENSKHIVHKRGFYRQYFVAIFISLLLSLVLLITVAAIIIFEVFIQKTIIQEVLSQNVSDKISLLEWGRYGFVIIMILLTVSILFKFGIKRDKNRAFISVGSVFTTILFIISSYGFGIWVVKFSKYNELYGSIGTLLIMMFYIWINCMILLLGFELDAAINKLKRERTI
jgi:membrane protein